VPGEADEQARFLGLRVGDGGADGDGDAEAGGRET
jgi:hypothetical protein